jgi:ketosteroid isomerase-like protein
MSQAEDEQAIRRIERMWDDAWNRHDANALAALLSDDVDFVNVTGAWFKGRPEFEERMAQTPQIAVVHARWEMSGLRKSDGTLRTPWQGIITRVVKKFGDDWVIVAAHNVDVAESRGGALSPLGL